MDESPINLLGGQFLLLPPLLVLGDQKCFPPSQSITISRVYGQ